VTATKEEVAKGLRQRGVDSERFPNGSWWVYELEVKLKAVLDLTDPGVLVKSGIEQASLTSSDLKVTRDIAVQARQQGYEALLVPSAAAANFKNLVIFLDKLPERPNVLTSRPANLHEEI